MGAHVGDRVVIEGNQVGAGRRQGIILQVLGEGTTLHFRVRWDDGHESTFFPGPDSTVVPASSTEGSEPLRAVSQVELRFEETDRRTMAWATFETTVGAFVGMGQAQRNPVDDNVPLIGEELAAARALMDLARNLEQAAGRMIEEGARSEAHLVG